MKYFNKTNNNKKKTNCISKKILETFEHPNIIHFGGFYFDNNFTYIIIDYAD